MDSVSSSKMSSPCINTCVIDPAHKICVGCGRTSAEIGGWMGYSETERRAVMATLAARLKLLEAS
jgi:uncharacterized protein